jgi:YidC/Oxa1 family membrane protein insertase
MFEFLDMIIVRPISNLLFVIYNVVGDFGLAILIFTLIVKFAMWPLVKKQFRQARLMRKLQPELAEIKKNCKGNRTMEQLQMMDLYKRYNVKPFGSLLTLIIQLPIFFALFFAITTVMPMTTDKLLEHPIEQKAYGPVKTLPRVQEIVEAQNSAQTIEEYSFRPKLFGVVDLSAHAIQENITPSSIVILLFAVLAALSQYWVAKQQLPTTGKKERRTLKQIMKETAEGKEADQSEINTIVSGQMTKFMPIMMFLIMISLVGALSFYYLLSNLVTIFQQRLMIRRETDELETVADKKILKDLAAAEEAQIVDPKDTKAAKSSKNKHVTRIIASTKKRRKK